MNPAEAHGHHPDVGFDGGDLDCGNGRLLLIRKHIDPLRRGQILEIRSTEISVDEDLPAECRMTRNELVSWTKEGGQRSFLVCKGTLAEREPSPPTPPTAAAGMRVVPVRIPDALPVPAAAPAIRPLSVMGVGSWPRPRWMLQAVHDRMEGRLDEAAFQATADDAVRLAVDTQMRAGADVVTDGEQRRDSYASFVGGLLDNFELATPRAGEIEALAALPDRQRIGVGVCNQKHAHIESVDDVVAKAERAIQLFGVERALLNPDCGFATFADNPVSSDRVAEGKLRALARAAALLR